MWVMEAARTGLMEKRGAPYRCLQTMQGGVLRQSAATRLYKTGPPHLPYESSCCAEAPVSSLFSHKFTSCGSPTLYCVVFLSLTGGCCINAICV